MVVIFPDSNSNELIRSFKPDYTPYEIFRSGVFQDHITNGVAGYWRPVYSEVAGRVIQDDYKQYDWGDLPLDKLVSAQPNINKNKYRTKAGSSLAEWESKGWIHAPDYRGWLQWYCEFFAGRRIQGYDDYQIKRWKSVKSRFGNVKKTPAIKQTLLNWAIAS